MRVWGRFPTGVFFTSSLRYGGFVRPLPHLIDQTDDKVEAGGCFSIASSSGVLMLPLSLGMQGVSQFDRDIV
jgi:hypothetical protein